MGAGARRNSRKMYAVLGGEFLGQVCGVIYVRRGERSGRLE